MIAILARFSTSARASTRGSASTPCPSSDNGNSLVAFTGRSCIERTITPRQAAIDFDYEHERRFTEHECRFTEHECGVVKPIQINASL